MATKKKVSTKKARPVINRPTREEEDRPDKTMTGEEIIAIPRRKTAKVKMPAEGVYIGSGVYHHSGHINCTGFCFTYWSPHQARIEDVVRLCKEEGVGNTLQFGQNDEEMLSLAREARDAGIYTTLLYSNASPEISGRLIPELGEWYLGYDFG